jgi:hypothetical protein
MSCWVAPAVAAEMWHCAVEQVLEAVRNGSIPSRIEGGFLLVEVALGSVAEPVKSKRRFVEEPDVHLALPPIMAPAPPRGGDDIVTPQEMAALEDWESEDEEESPVLASAEESSKYDMSQWRQIRKATSRIRKPPR